MFAHDFDTKGVSVSVSVSVALHVLVLLLVLFVQHRNLMNKEKYMLTEVTMIEQVPDEQKPQPQVQMPKPKSVFDILKNIIPIKQKTNQLELAKPKMPELSKPKIEPLKQQALDMDKLKADNLKQPMKSIDIDNEIGKKKLSPAMVEQAKLQMAQKQNQLAQAPASLKLTENSKQGSWLPVAQPQLSGKSFNRSAGIAAAPLKIGQPTPAPKKNVEEQLNIPKEKGAALLVSGEIQGRKIITAVAPRYPRSLEEQGIEAQVAVDIVVTASGNVKDNAYVSLSSGYTEFDQPALEAAKELVFAPLSGNGEDQSGTVLFKFQLTR